MNGRMLPLPCHWLSVIAADDLSRGRVAHQTLDWDCCCFLGSELDSIVRSSKLVFAPLSLRACGVGRRYAQAGTPQVKLEPSYDAAARTLTLTASQKTPPTPGQESKAPVLIPLRIALLAADGRALPLHLKVGASRSSEL